MRDFLRLGPRDSKAFLRVVNLGAPTEHRWVDEKDKSALLWDGDRSDVGANPGITVYAETDSIVGYIGNFQ